MNTRGVHILLDMWGIPENIIRDNDWVFWVIREAAFEANMTVKKSSREDFEPYGMTAILLLAESHLSIHTYPEESYVAVDIFTCGDKAKPDMAVRFIKDKLSPSHVQENTIIRGERTHREKSVCN